MTFHSYRKNIEKYIDELMKSKRYIKRKHRGFVYFAKGWNPWCFVEYRYGYVKASEHCNWCSPVGIKWDIRQTIYSDKDRKKTYLLTRKHIKELAQINSQIKEKIISMGLEETTI